MAKTLTRSESRCLLEERDRLREAIHRCDLCSTSLEVHRHCYEDTARKSGERSKDCFS